MLTVPLLPCCKTMETRRKMKIEVMRRSQVAGQVTGRTRLSKMMENPK